MAISKTKLYWTDVDSEQTITVIFDAITSMTPEDTVDITDHPVEVGADVTDHARSKLGRLTLEAIVSMVPNPALDKDVSLSTNTLDVSQRAPGPSKTFALEIPSVPVQLSETGLLNAGFSALKGALFGGPSATVNGVTRPKQGQISVSTIQQDAPRNRVRELYDVLLKLKDDHTLVTILTAERDHFDMMVERIAKPRAAGDGSSAKFQIDFKQVRTVNSQTVSAPKPVEKRAAKPVNGGTKNGKPAPKPEDSESLMKQAGGGIKGLLGGN